MVTASPVLLEPAAAVPVTPKIGFELRHHHEVADSGRNRQLATGTAVFLACLVRLDLVDQLRRETFGHPPKNPHSTTATVSSTNPATRRMSTVVLRCWRNGLRPTEAMVEGSPGATGHLSCSP